MNVIERNTVRLAVEGLEDRRLLTAGALLGLDLKHLASAVAQGQQMAAPPMQVSYAPAPAAELRLPAVAIAQPSLPPVPMIDHGTALAPLAQAARAQALAAVRTIDLKPKLGPSIEALVKKITPSTLRDKVSVDRFIADSTGKLELKVSVRYKLLFIKATFELTVSTNIKTKAPVKVSLKVPILGSISFNVPYIKSAVVGWVASRAPEILRLIR